LGWNWGWVVMLDCVNWVWIYGEESLTEVVGLPFGFGY
jgi:hypothetical protein